MRLLISTPCSGGMLYEQYVGSLLQSANRALDEGLLEYWEVAFQGKESLIHRARNRAATDMLINKFDKLLTIDADIAFTYEDFKRIISHDLPIVGGCYPLKAFPVVVNFNPFPDQFREFVKSERGFDYDAFSAYVNKYADPDTGLVEVRHIPTGFMCVRGDVFGKLSETVPTYFSRVTSSSECRGFFDFYPSLVKENILESEDWGFCRIATEAGFKIHLDTRIQLGHVGYHEFRLGQVFGEITPIKT